MSHDIDTYETLYYFLAWLESHRSRYAYVNGIRCECVADVLEALR